MRPLFNRLSGALPDWPAFFLTQFPAVCHVWRTEGSSVLLHKLRRRLSTTALVLPTRPVLVPDREPFKPLDFSHVANPRVSIIIPAFNRLSFTHRCLAALKALPDATAFEPIVVDDCSIDRTSEQLANYAYLRCLRNSENQGFVYSCNRGASQARGDLLVFLNNDTQVQPGWLDALVATFDSRPDAGLAGSRLIYPDGRLQEAGGILFADGSAWSYGHLDDPYKPKYSYLRKADYCSGAALAIPRQLFERLGGFDPDYAPGYYEDTDLAMRVRELGYGVYYQPKARVVHFEGVSAGTDRGPVVTGMKRFQAINRQTFLAKWGARLTGLGTRGDNLERAKERCIRRRAFVIDTYMLTPDKDSGSLRMLNLFSILRGFGYKITFAAANLEAPEPYVSELQTQGIECLYRPYIRSIARHLAERGREYDLVILSRADAAARFLSRVRRDCPNARVVFDTVDLHFLRESRLAELTGDRATRALAKRRKAQELRLIDAADATLVVSDAELRLLRSERPHARLHLVSNIHRIYGSARPFSERRDILFIGAFAHPPNTDAVRWLVRDILPLVWAEQPDLLCHVIGAEPPLEIRTMASRRVLVHGHVPDVGSFFSGCRLSVAPLRYGSGVKGKINQSLAYGLPVVATPLAAEGMYLVDGESALIAAESADFARAILRLYTDAALWLRISAAGIETMESHFSFASARRAVAEVIDVDA